ncbi:MAG: M61 family peptidase [Gemmatimonadetes bacterium]|nr:M61 family peptidase [Gemmatimonadota bacterium]
MCAGAASRLAIAALLAGTSPLLAQARDTVTYEVSFPNAAHHEAEITATFAGLSSAPLEVRMSRSSPGRYALHEFAKNVYSVRVTDGSGRALTPTRPDPYGWGVRGHDGTVRITYTLFADLADGTYAGVDRSHAHLNIPAAFMYARGLQSRPVRVTFRPPPGSAWRVATQLEPTNDPFTFTAPDLDYFMDSPTEVADFKLREWNVTSSGREQTIRLAVHDPGTDADVDRYAEMAMRVVAEQSAVFGEFPAYDFGTYTFVACYGPWASGDGMEHRNSTSLTSSGTLERSAGGLLGTLSHEFFHSWNMERIRSSGIEPFDYERANMSDELWFGEGFTQYYTNLFVTRAGLMAEDRYVSGLAGTINAVVNGPGRRYNSVVEMSRMAPFWDAAASIDPTNQQNTFISYYTWGAAIGLGLDLTLRTRFDRSLDGFMRAMWVKYGKPFRPYTLDDLRATLGEYTGDTRFADDFFARYIHGREVVDYAALLAGAGVLVRRENEGRATFGPAVLRLEDGRVVVRAVYVGTALYDAGLDDGDVIVALDGTTVTSVDQIEEITARHDPGDAISVTFESRGQTLRAGVTLIEDVRLEVVLYEEAGLNVTSSMRELRADWLGSKAEN